MPNPWDVGSARLLAHLGFAALATTSSGFAGTLGRLDGTVGRDEALAHAASIVAAVGVPVSADLENGFGDLPDDVAQTVEGARAAGLAGCSIEDYTGDADDPIYSLPLAVDRIAAAARAARAAHAGPGLVLTARAENYLHGRRDLADTVARLRAYQDAGADVLYAPGLSSLEDIRKVVKWVDRPVNVLVRPDGPTVAELASAGVARISVGGAFSFAALGAVVRAARELRERGTHSFLELAAEGRAAAVAAFTPPSTRSGGDADAQP
jgi:2-methylisocitrate lyase-like PEP mutase family enzyme